MTDQQQPQQPSKAKTAGALVAVIGVAAAAILSPFVAGWESGGKPNLVAYHGKYDPPGLYTICNGDTIGVKRGDTETPTGCALRFDQRLAQFAKPVLACTPALKGHDHQLAAAISLAYNIGTGAYCRSTVDRRFDTGQWRSACDAFLMWDRAGGQVVQGLKNRREAERRLCLEQVPA